MDPSPPDTRFVGLGPFDRNHGSEQRRQSHVTASEMADVLRVTGMARLKETYGEQWSDIWLRKHTPPPGNVDREPPSPRNRFMRDALCWGQTYEDTALRKYEELMMEPGERQMRVGSYVDERERLLATPDSVVVGRNVRLVEIKCPYRRDSSVRNWFPSAVPKLQYFWQMMCQMWCTRIGRCDLFIWTPDLGAAVWRVRFNRDLWDSWYDRLDAGRRFVLADVQPPPCVIPPRELCLIPDGCVTFHRVWDAQWRVDPRYD